MVPDSRVLMAEEAENDNFGNPELSLRRRIATIRARALIATCEIYNSH